MFEGEVRISQLWTWHQTLRGVQIGALVAFFEASGLEVHELGMVRICTPQAEL